MKQKNLLRLFVAVMMAALLCSTAVIGVSAAETTVPPTTVAEDIFDAAIEDGTLKILAIGNSYSRDALHYLYDVLEAAGYTDEVDVVVANMYRGSCSLAMHVDRIDGDPADYTYYENSTGSWKTTANQTLEQGIAKHADWDFISLQQSSTYSGDPDSYDASLSTLVDYVKSQNSTAKLLWHMTWTWDEEHAWTRYENQADMYAKICSTVQTKIKDDTFVGIVPSGTAVRNAATSHYNGDLYLDDNVHLNDVGRLAAACTWYAALTGDSVDAAKVPGHVIHTNGIHADAAVMAEAANNAIKTPFGVTNSNYTATGHSHAGWTKLTAGGTLSAGKYYLEDALAVTSPITVSGDVTLCLNGKTLTACAAEGGSFITVPSGASLTICDSTGGVISGASAGTNTRGIEVQFGGALTLSSGTISGFTTAANGGGVYVNGGTFTMNGGVISGNESTLAANSSSSVDIEKNPGGGGVCNNAGTFTMTGGTIELNTAKRLGGGVYALGAHTTKITGGSISGNKADYQGGGLAVRTKAATISGGTIGGTAITAASELGAGTGNYASSSGGGVYMGYNQTFSGTVDIRGNCSGGTGGGIRAQASVTLSGNAQVRENYAKTTGGGIYAAYNLTIKDEVKIASNTAVSTGGGAMVAPTVGGTRTVSMTGGSITDNVSSSNGGGLYLGYTDATETKAAGVIKAVISGGSISGNTGNRGDQLYVLAGTATVSGGTITDRADNNNEGLFGASRSTVIITDAAIIESKIVPYNGATLTIEPNPSILGKIEVQGSTASTVSISGGKFSQKTEKATLEGWLVDGKYLHSVAGYYQVADTEQVLVPCTLDHSDWAPISAAMELNAEGGKYYLAADIVGIVSDSSKYGINVTADNVTLCMCGFSIVPENSAASALRCGAKNFVLCNGTNDGGYLQGKSVRTVLVADGASMEMGDNVHIDGANITGGNSYGAAVMVNGTATDGGSFAMKGGTIRDNTVTSPSGYSGTGSYGAIALNGSTAQANLEGVTISGNSIVISTTGSTARAGGACVNVGGKLNIGGDMLIDSNEAASNKGVATGGIYNYGGTVNMTGGTISNHTAAVGAGVYNTGTVNLSGTALISENAATSYGGGIYATSGTVTISGGTVQDNTAGSGGNGGGAYITADAALTMTAGTITGTGNVLYINSNNYSKISGGTINGNVAPTSNANATSTQVELTGDVTVTGHVLAYGIVKISGGEIGGDVRAYGAEDIRDVTITGGKIKGEVKKGSGTVVGTILISGGKFSDKTTRDALVGFLATDAGTLSIVDNADSDSAAYPYKVVEGYVRMGEFMDFKSSLNLTITLGADYGFTADEVTVTVNGSNVSPAVVENTMIIPVSGIVAKAMDDEYNVAVTKGEQTLYTETLSVYKLAKEWHADVDHADAKIMLEDMINYGIEAQRAFENGVVTMTELGAGTSDVPDWGEVTGSVTNAQQSKVAVTLSLKDKIELNIYVNDPAATSASVEGVPVTNKDGRTITRFTFDDIAVKDAKTAKELTVTLADGETSFDVEYSIADYAIRANESGNDQQALIQALMKYVDSVSAYLTAAQ